MSSTITAGNATNGLALSCDNTGILELKTGTGSGTTAITADASQNVGVGTTTPSTKLHVVGVVTATQGVTGTPTFSASQTNAQTISRTTYTKLQYNVEDWDTASCYDNSTNYRFTPNVAGYYQVNARMQFALDATARDDSFMIIYKNGSSYKRLPSFGSVANSYSNPGGSVLVYMNGSTDYIEAYVYYGGGSATSAVNNSGGDINYFQASLVRAA